MLAKKRAQPYGGRWKVVDGETVGSGGQGDVYRVQDVTGELVGDYALKRVNNRTRRDRFVSEVLSIARLDHVNIVKLIDHSALDSDAADKQYLVMPLARGGDLGDADRITLYKDSIDATITVVKQVASALAHAHDAGIIHRDVKPNNILFAGKGHDVWLSDFGICLIRDGDRNTPDGEAVGPRAFMAPELEGGGKLEVSPSADIYSLGKLIYFMLSGGVVLPRERLYEPDFQKHMPQGERAHLVGNLLNRMICPDATRLQSMSEVITQLDRIATWEERATDSILKPDAISDMHALQSQMRRVAQIEQQNAENHSEEQRRVDLTVKGVKELLTLKLSEAGEALSSDLLSLKAWPDAVSSASIIKVHQRKAFEPIANVGLLARVSEPGRQSWLIFYLCRVLTGQVILNLDGPHGPSVRPVRDVRLCLVATAQLAGTHDTVYLTRPEKIGSHMYAVPPLGQPSVLRGRSMQVVTPAESSCHEAVALVQEFNTSEWPGNSDAIHEFASTALGAYVKLLVSTYNN